VADRRITPEQFDALLVEYTMAVQEMATLALSPAPDALARRDRWQQKAADIARQIREGVFG
jgi:hypothetical protein